MLIQIKDGIPIGYAVAEENFRMLFPGATFPAMLTPELVEPFGYGLYDFSSQPTPNKHEKVVEATPIKNGLGVWIQSWGIVAMNDEEKTQADKEKALLVREDRNWRLAQCDWTQLIDSPVDHFVWFSYRQALRDIPSQSGFPWTIEWPEQP